MHKRSVLASPLSGKASSRRWSAVFAPILTAILLLSWLAWSHGTVAAQTIYIVNSTADPGDGTCDASECTLREAIEAANSSAGTIQFNIAGAGPHTIALGSALPAITNPLIIDGTTEPDFLGTPIIELNGMNAGAGAHGLHITAGSSTVRGLVINRFSGNGILIETNGDNLVEGNYIGTDVSGSADLGNGGSGVHIIESTNNIVGGSTSAARNVISGNQGEGVRIDGANAYGNLIQGN